MDLVEAYTSGGGAHPEEGISIRLEVYALPSSVAASLIRSAAPNTDHAPEHRAATALLRRNEARLVQSITLPCRSGQRARNEDGYELWYLIPESGGGADESEQRLIESTVQHSHRRVGTWLEADPVLGVDGITIDLRIRLEVHTGDPLWKPVAGKDRESVPGTLHPQFHLKTLEFSSVVSSGETRLIGSWRTEADNGKAEENSYHLVFLQAFVTFDPPTYAP